MRISNRRQNLEKASPRGFLRFCIWGLTASAASNILYCNPDEKEEYAVKLPTEKTAHRLRGRRGEILRKVAFEGADERSSPRGYAR